jgi:hypothetical protein
LIEQAHAGPGGVLALECDQAAGVDIGRFEELGAVETVGPADGTAHFGLQEEVPFERGVWNPRPEALFFDPTLKFSDETADDHSDGGHKVSFTSCHILPRWKRLESVADRAGVRTECRAGRR